MMQRQFFVDELINAARECIGTPFHHQGRALGRGMDCAGVVTHALRRTGIAFNDTPAYPRHPYKNMMRNILNAQPGLERVQREHMIPGDILLMRFTREPQHLALLAAGTIIHAYSDIGKVVEHDFSPEWRRRVIDVYRVIT